MMGMKMAISLLFQRMLITFGGRGPRRRDNTVSVNVNLPGTRMTRFHHHERHPVAAAGLLQMGAPP